MHKTVKYKIKGVVPLIVHNGQLCDPLNEYAKALKQVSSKKKKTDDDYLEMARIEWYGGLYLNDKRQPIMPGVNVEAMLIDAAKKSKKGMDFKAAIFVDEDPLIEHKGPKDIDKLHEDKRFVLRAPVVVGQARVMRTRPWFQEWEMQFSVKFLPDILNQSDVDTAVQTAGRIIGMGTWNPRHGRFEVV